MEYGTSRARRARYECKCKCRMVLFIQSDSHSCTTRCDAMFLSIPFYKMKVILLQYFDAIVSKKLCICVKEGGKFNHQKAQKNFPELQVRIDDLTTLRVLIRTIYRDSNGEQGRNLNTSDRLTMHTWWKSIWCRKNSTSCHNVMCNTEIMQILTLRVQIPLSLRHHLKVIVSLASIGQPKMWMSSSMISLQPYRCIMHVVISHNVIIIIIINLLICYSVF